MAKNIFPYELPANWQWATWGQCGKFIAGSGFKKEYQGLKNYEIPFYKVGSLKFSNSQGYIQDKDNTINKNILKILKAQLIPKDSLLFAKIGEAIRLNRRALNNVPCCIDNNMIAFISEKILPRYVYYWSQSIDLYIYTNATTVPAIRKSDLEKIQIPLPPLDEQKRIVAVIESLFEKLDAAKSIVQKILDGYELRRAAILHKAFIGELTKNFRADSGLTLDDWQEKKLGDVITKIKYGTSAKSSYHKSNFPVLRIPNITEKGVDFSDLKYLSQAEENCRVHKDDILIIRSNGSRNLVGKCALMPESEKKFFYASFLISISPAQNIFAKFLLMYLNSESARNQMFIKAKSSAGIHNINSEEIQSVKINLPPLDEQKEIVRVLDSLPEKEQRTKEIAEKILSEIDLLKRTILARAFRGELGTNNPSEKLEGLY